MMPIRGKVSVVADDGLDIIASLMILLLLQLQLQTQPGPPAPPSQTL